ncbi:MAG: methyltransferase domain-containing protein [Candidatus Riflebacteria bacterium]
MTGKDRKDVSFDQLKERFRRNVYQTGKGEIRLALTRADMLASIPELASGKSLRILDAGGGMGQMAIWLAAMGHQVTMADISEEMLNHARENLENEQLADRVRIFHAAIQDLPGLLAGKSFDLILLHGVIAWLEKPLQAVESLLPLLASGGRMSVLYFNRDKLILKWGITGQIESALSGRGRKKGSLTPVNPVSFAEFAAFCAEKKLTIISKAGIRIFYRFFLKFPESFQVSIEDFIRLELQYCRTEPYASLGEHTHLVIKAEDR